MLTVQTPVNSTPHCLCRFDPAPLPCSLQDCEFTYLSVQILHLLGEEGPATKDPGTLWGCAGCLAGVRLVGGDG